MYLTPPLVQEVVSVTASCVREGLVLFDSCHEQLVTVNARNGARFWSKDLTYPTDLVLNQEQALYT